ncbi:MAG: hypothetical protein H0W89_01545 [Candidatus Levybacteria bacterium]|nr:hypothetical protein [Candidatus Levybacteria bacterium]
MSTLPFELPDGYTPIVKEGDVVTPGQILAEFQGSVEEFVNVPEQLGVALKNAGKYIKKNPGETIEAGEVLAVRKNLFGKIQASITSEVGGTILRYERDTGNLIVQTDQMADMSHLISPVDGTVQLCNNKEIVIHTDKAVAGTRVASGTKGEGEIYVLKESFIENSSGNVIFYLDNNAVGKIILGNTFTRDVLIKGFGIGAAGFLGQSISDQDIEYLREKKITMPVMEVSPEAIATLLEMHGQKVILDAQTRTVIFLKA